MVAHVPQELGSGLHEKETSTARCLLQKTTNKFNRIRFLLNSGRVFGGATAQKCLRAFLGKFVKNVIKKSESEDKNGFQFETNFWSRVSFFFGPGFDLILSQALPH